MLLKSTSLTWAAAIALLGGVWSIAALLWKTSKDSNLSTSAEGRHQPTSPERSYSVGTSNTTANDPFRQWRIRADAERKRLENAGVYNSPSGPGFALVDQNFKVLPSALKAAGAPESILPELQCVVDRAWEAHSRSLAARLQHRPDRAGHARYRIWASVSEGERILENVHSEIIVIAGVTVGERLMEAFCSGARRWGDGFGLLDIEIEDMGSADEKSLNSYRITKYHTYNGASAGTWEETIGTAEFRRLLGSVISQSLAPTEP